MVTQIDFSDTKTAFAHRSDRELYEAHLLFTLMNFSGLVRACSKLAALAMRWRLPVTGLIKRTIYRQFCGGETIEEAHRVIDALGEYGIKTILDYGMEGKETEADFDRYAGALEATLAYAQADEDIHIISTKLSGLFRHRLLEKVTAGEVLSTQERAEYDRGFDRVDRIARAARMAHTGLHIDAEESWIQGGVDAIAWELSRRYNDGIPTIINAIQLYRKDQFDFLRDSLAHARQNGYLCAVKLVRGAYMEKERTRAAERGYPSPIHDTLQETHRAYNDGLKFCIENLGDLYVCNATHNEASVRYQVELMEERGFDPGHPLVATAQLYGMSDNLSFNMAAAGYHVEKYLPYGPVREVVPYLIRRTQENSSVGGQMSRELALIRRELERRKG